MKHFKQPLIYLSILSILITFFISGPKVYADVPANQIVVKHTDKTWSGYPFDYRLQNAYFTVNNSNNLIPTSTNNTPLYFYTDDNITFYELSGKDVYTTVLNRGVGITTASDLLALLVTDFFNYAALTSDGYIQGGLYDENNLFLGYCLNDISGCYYIDLQTVNKPAVDVPSEYTNDVYNHYKYYNDNNSALPDFITVYPPSLEFINSHYYDINNFTTPENGANILSNIASLTNSNEYLYYLQVQPSGRNAKEGENYKNLQYKYTSANEYGLVAPLNNLHFITPNNGYNWTTFCNEYELDKNHYELLFSDIWDKGYDNKSGNVINYWAYDSQGNHVTSFAQNKLQDGTSYSNATYSEFILGFGMGLGGIYPFIMCGGSQPYTIYRTEDIYNGVKNKTYTPSQFQSITYTEYNLNDDNSFEVTVSNIDNSQNLNTTIYQETVNNFADSSDNSSSTINKTEIDNSTTTIINNYYPDPNNNTPDNPDNPDNPIEDETILDAILAALKRFFDAIGKILGTILAGLLEVIDSVLESIAGIMENLTGVTEFIGALFSWIPEPVPQILAAGISICILAAIVKFIRG